MPLTFVSRQRLYNQGIALPTFKRPEDVVSRLVAVQAQEYAQAKWAVGLRMCDATDVQLEQALTEGAILRTYVMRPTWHFVAAGDIRWLLALTAPRVTALSASYYRKTELDEAIFRKAEKTLIKALQGGKYLTRTELQASLAAAKIKAEGLRLGLLMMYAELGGLVCSGPRRGKQHTYGLLEERVPAAPILVRDEALASLVSRYFATRGPATLHDFAWWSGLSMKDARDGAAMLPKAFERQTIDGKEYMFIPSKPGDDGTAQTTLLLPDYDEYGISYKDRSAMAGSVPGDKGTSIGFPHLFVVNGVEGGRWKRTTKDGKMTAETVLWGKPTKASILATQQAVERYETFANG